ncbi:MAG TPA: M48 family metalloprotease [Anaerolineales bacterium]|nr:M48 family metalloprotease [Anaerolineales bacterium]
MYRQPYLQRRVGLRSPTSSGGCLRIGLALAMVGFAVLSFLGSKQFNPVTGEDQYVSLTQDQEIALGLQAAPEMAAQFGGLEPDPEYQAVVDTIGQNLLELSFADNTAYPFEFHVLADREAVNAFALPGGQVFVTRGLVDSMETEGQLAGVLAHEIIHVLARHSAEQIAQAQLAEGITGAVLIATYDPENPSSAQLAQMAALVGQLINMKYGREDEIQSDELGVKVMSEAGYDPRSMIRVMEILAAANPGRQSEFFSTHPNPDNRIRRIEAAIQDLYPDGVPGGLVA